MAQETEQRKDTVFVALLPSGVEAICMTRRVAESIENVQRKAVAMENLIGNYRSRLRTDSLLISSLEDQVGNCERRSSALSLQVSSLKREIEATQTVSQSYESLYRKERRKRRALVAGVIGIVATSAVFQFR